MALVKNPMAKLYSQKLSLRKGAIYDDTDPNFPPVTLYNWDAVPFCSTVKCPAVKYCDFTHNDRIKCAAHATYLKHVVQILVFENPMIDNFICFRIGSELIPLYSMLFLFFIEEIGLDKRFWQKGSKPYVHPVFKENRETIKLIAITRDKIGIPKSLNVNMNTRGLFNAAPHNGNGDPEALKKMRRRKR